MAAHGDRRRHHHREPRMGGDGPDGHDRPPARARSPGSAAVGKDRPARAGGGPAELPLAGRRTGAPELGLLPRPTGSSSRLPADPEFRDPRRAARILGRPAKHPLPGRDRSARAPGRRERRLPAHRGWDDQRPAVPRRDHRRAAGEHRARRALPLRRRPSRRPYAGDRQRGDPPAIRPGSIPDERHGPGAGSGRSVPDHRRGPAQYAALRAAGRLARRVPLEGGRPGRPGGRQRPFRNLSVETAGAAAAEGGPDVPQPRFRRSGAGSAPHRRPAPARPLRPSRRRARSPSRGSSPTRRSTSAGFGPWTPT